VFGGIHADYQKLKKRVLQDDFLFCQSRLFGTAGQQADE
jgi:hypothetical protein